MSVPLTQPASSVSVASRVRRFAAVMLGLARLTWCRLDKLQKLGFFKGCEAGETYVNEILSQA